MQTISQYAKAHKITRQATHKRVVAGKVEAVKVGKVWIITDRANK